MEAAGNVQIFVCEAELCSLGSPQGILVPRPWGCDHPVLHPQNISIAFGLGICIFSCVGTAELLHFSALGMSLWWYILHIRIFPSTGGGHHFSCSPKIKRGLGRGFETGSTPFSPHTDLWGTDCSPICTSLPGWWVCDTPMPPHQHPRVWIPFLPVAMSQPSPLDHIPVDPSPWGGKTNHHQTSLAALS